MPLKFRTLLTLVFVIIVANGALGEEPKRPNNLILFVPDGLRALSVTADSAPAMTAVRDSGVNFKNSHSVFPTFTTANASTMATGHQLGDTGTPIRFAEPRHPLIGLDPDQHPREIALNDGGSDVGDSHRRPSPPPLSRFAGKGGPGSRRVGETDRREAIRPGPR